MRPASELEVRRAGKSVHNTTDLDLIDEMLYRKGGGKWFLRNDDI
jgi:hypothetical protein